MPKSKRAKVVSLTKTEKKTREHKETLFKDIQTHVDKWQYIYVFEVGDMRNAPLKDVRNLWKNTGRIFVGRGRVMAKALGNTEETEHKPGLAKLAERVRGEVGLFFTDSPPQEVTDWFDDFKVSSFARAKHTASRTVVIPEGPIMQQHCTPPEPFSHSMEPQLRKLGLTTKMERGVPSLDVPHTVCKEGDVLTADQAQILKLIGEKLSVFRVVLLSRYDSSNGEVTTLVEDDEEAAKAGDDGDDDMDEDENVGDADQ